MRSAVRHFLRTLGVALFALGIASLVEGIFGGDLLSFPSNLPRVLFVIIVTFLGFRCLLGSRDQVFSTGGSRVLIGLLLVLISISLALCVLWLVNT